MKTRYEKNRLFKHGRSDSNGPLLWLYFKMLHTFGMRKKAVQSEWEEGLNSIPWWLMSLTKRDMFPIFFFKHIDASKYLFSKRHVLSLICERRLTSQTVTKTNARFTLKYQIGQSSTPWLGRDHKFCSALSLVFKWQALSFRLKDAEFWQNSKHKHGFYVYCLNS